MKEIGNKISICRQNKNMTQDELAKRLGVTSQAVSKWERGLSLPYICVVKSICDILDISADYLLGVEVISSQDKYGREYNDEILCNLRNSLNQLELVFGKGLASVFQDDTLHNEIISMRTRLSREGIILPILRVCDYIQLKDDEFMILSNQNVLYAEEVANEIDIKYIVAKAEGVIRLKYAEIISPDIMKLLVDNLKEKYPALIEGIVPEKISYALLTAVTKNFMNRGNGIVYLPRILEFMQYHMVDNSNATVEELTGAVIEGIEVKENFWVYTASRI